LAQVIEKVKWENEKEIAKVYDVSTAAIVLRLVKTGFVLPGI
jgi:hypothetical protein